jgi:hypothetical protein
VGGKEGKVMVAFYLGLILGALGGFLFLGLLSMVVRKDRLMEAPERVKNCGKLLVIQGGKLRRVTQ